MGEQRRIGRDSPEQVRIGWQMAGLGFQSTSEVIAGALLGWLWDLWRGTAPTGVLIGSITGLVVGLYTLVRQSLRLNRRLDEITRQKRASRGKPAPPP
ncbi:MAG: AtpZ/AtpI family protein, partial [Planctomycetota bacterium]